MTDRLTVLELGRVLAEVPEVAVVVLGIPVERVLDRDAVLGHKVVDDARLDPHNGPCSIRDPDLDALVAVAVDPHRSGRHRPKRVVDLGAEARRIDLDRFAPLRERLLLIAPAPREQDGCGDDGQASHVLKARTARRAAQAAFWTSAAGRERPRGLLFPLRRDPARRRDLLPLVRPPHRCAGGGRTRGPDRRPARRAALLRSRHAAFRPRGGGHAARGRDRPGRDRLPRRGHRRDRDRLLPPPRLSRRRATLAGHVDRQARGEHRRPDPRRGRLRGRVGLGLVTGRPGRRAATQGAVHAPAPARRQGSRPRRLLLLRRRPRRRAEGVREGARRADGLERARAAAGRRERASADAQAARDGRADRGDRARTGDGGGRGPSPSPSLQPRTSR